MAEASLTQAESARERTPLRVRLRWAFHRSLAAVLPRRLAIRWEMRSNRRFYAKVLAEAEARNAADDEMQALEAEAAHFYRVLEEELEMLESRRLLRQAKKHFIQPPKWPRDLNDPGDDPNWRRGTSFKPDLYLTPQAMHDLRTKIRAEDKAWRESVIEWLKIVGGLGGVFYLLEKVSRIFR